jgi:SAM-dependent methyltransferase
VSLGRIFDEDAEGYDRARPSYPSGIVDAIPRGRLLEIGCGTGKLTKDLVARGDDVLGVEPGANLAALARRYAPVELSTFEEWDPAGRTFDAVVCATAWHWLDPATRVQRAFALAPALAIVDTHHGLPDAGDDLFRHQHLAYGRWEDDDQGPPQHPDDVAPLRAAELGDVEIVREVVAVTYSPDEFFAVLDTYSGHRALDADTRRGLYDELRSMMGETVTKHYLFELAVAPGAARAPG